MIKLSSCCGAIIFLDNSAISLLCFYFFQLRLSAYIFAFYCWKTFERMLHNNIYDLFTENNLIYPNQSGFKAGDSCINQLLSITHEFYKFFDDGLEIRGIFSDVSKTFDEVWHKGLLYKLKQNHTSGKLFHIITDFLNFKKQRVVLNTIFFMD